MHSIRLQTALRVQVVWPRRCIFDFARITHCGGASQVRTACAPRTWGRRPMVPPSARPVPHSRTKLQEDSSSSSSQRRMGTTTLNRLRRPRVRVPSRARPPACPLLLQWVWVRARSKTHCRQPRPAMDRSTPLLRCSRHWPAATAGPWLRPLRPPCLRLRPALRSVRCRTLIIIF